MPITKRKAVFIKLFYWFYTMVVIAGFQYILKGSGMCTNNETANNIATRTAITLKTVLNGGLSGRYVSAKYATNPSITTHIKKVTNVMLFLPLTNSPPCPIFNNVINCRKTYIKFAGKIIKLFSNIGIIISNKSNIIFS